MEEDCRDGRRRLSGSRLPRWEGAIVRTEQAACISVGSTLELITGVPDCREETSSVAHAVRTKVQITHMTVATFEM